MSEWRECKLGEIAGIQTGPFGSQLHASDYVIEGIPSIMPANINGNMRIITDDIARIRTNDAKRLEKYIVNENDIVYSRRGDVEKCAFITSRESGWLCGTGCLRVRFTSSAVFPKYCAYYLSTDKIKAWVSANAVGSTMPNLNETILSNVPVRFPSIPTQRAIAEVLSSLDDKIDLLKRQNTTLEALAQTYFRQWFVEENCELKRLDSIAKVTMGQPPSGASYNEDGIGTVFFQGRGEFGWRYPSVRLFTTKPQQMAKRGDTLMSVRAPVGDVNIAESDCCIGRGLAAISCNHQTFVFYALKEQSEQLEIFNGEGTVFGSITKEGLNGLQIHLPSEAKIREFDNRFRVLDKKIECNNTQILTLQKLRNTLLPKLISGEVRIKN
jgi:type I restriction enzyme S subunit